MLTSRAVRGKVRAVAAGRRGPRGLNPGATGESVNKKKWYLVPAVVAVAGALLFFLPVLLGLRPVAMRVLALAGVDLPGTLQVERCSLGWLGPFTCRGLSYEHPQLGLRAEVAEVRGDKGLLALLLAPRYLGELTLIRPEITVRGERAEAAPAAAEPADSPPPPPAEPTATSPLPWWERLAFRLHATDGRIALDQGPAGRQELARDLHCSGSLARGTVNYTFGFRSGRQNGRLQAEGFVNLPTVSQSFLDALISRTDVTVQALELAPFLDLAAARGDTPAGGGTLDGTVHVATAGIEELKLQGEAMLRHLRLSGGVLGEDRPELASLSATFHGSRTRRDGWRFSDLRVDSEAIRLVGQGQLDSRSVGLAVSGTVRLPVVAAQLPHLLALHRDTVVREGALDFSVDVSGRPQDLLARTEWRASRLVAVHKAQEYSWDAPLTLSAEIEHRQGQTRARDLRLQTPFFQGTGSGGVDDFKLAASADLAQMSRELEKLFVLPYSGRGRVELNGSSRREAEGYRLQGRVEVAGLAVLRDGRPLLPTYDFFLEGDVAAGPTFYRDGRITGLQARTLAWPGQLDLTLDSIGRHQGALQATVAATGTLDLERLSRLLQGEKQGGGASLRGQLSFTGRGAVNGQRLVVEQLGGRVEEPVIATGAFRLQRPELDFTLEDQGPVGREAIAVRQLVVAANWRELAEKDRAVAIVDTARRQLDLRQLVLRTGGLTARGGLHVGDWSRPSQDLAAEIDLAGETGPLVALGRAAGLLAGDLDIRGRVRAGGTVAAAGDRPPRTELEVELDNAEVLSGGRRLFRERQLRCEVQSEGLFAPGQEVRLPAVRLRSALVQADGAGRVRRGEPAVLELQGRLTPDLSLLGDPLTAAIGQQIRLGGKSPAAFRLSWPLRLPLNAARASLTTTLRADTFQFRDLGLHQLDIPVELGAGSVRALIAGDLYAGRVALQPQWQFASARPQVTIQPTAKLLDGVDVQSPVASGLLVGLHPMFGPLLRVEGSIDLRLDAFHWPLQQGAAGRPTFQATLGLKELRLQPGRETAAALHLAGLDQTSLELLSPELACEGRDGRISCSPLRLRSGAAELRLNGVTGMDGSLDFRLELPTSERLLGAPALALLGQGRIEAPFVGTITAPRFDRQAFQAAVTAQLRRAAALQRQQEAAARAAAGQRLREAR